MTENFKKFLEKVSNDINLQKALEFDSNDKNVYMAHVKSVAKGAGFDLSDKDFEEETVQLSKEEMAAITGAGGCGCAWIGGGGGSGLVCACLKAGTGFVKGYSGISSQGGCVCYWGGAGATNRH